MKTIDTTEKQVIQIHFPLDQAGGVMLVPWVLKDPAEPNHWHHALEVSVCLEGRGVFYLSQKQHEIGPGDVTVINNIERHTAQSLPGERCSCLFLLFDMFILQLFDATLLRPFAYNPKYFAHRIDAASPIARRIHALLTEIYTESVQCDPAYKQMCRSLLLQICALLVRHYEQQCALQEWRLHSYNYQRIQEVLTYLHNNFQREITLQHVADMLGLSLSRTRHLFQEVTGESFKSYLAQLRLQHARTLLQSDHPITCVYLDSGFSNPSTFYRQFKRAMGITPQQYRFHSTS